MDTTEWQYIVTHMCFFAAKDLCACQHDSIDFWLLRDAWNELFLDNTLTA